LGSNLHYEHVVQKHGRTRFASCGYQDRFDPFLLNKNPRLHRFYRGLFESVLAGLPSGRLLDVGAGTGIYFDALAPFAREIEALDNSEDMVRVADWYCRANGLTHIHPSLGSADHLPFGNGEFDVVICLDTLHHVSDLGQALSEVDRVLKEGGHFFVFEPNINNPLTFLAHAIPREERSALGRNRPAVLRRNLETRFDTVFWRGVSAMVTQCRGIKGFAFDAYLKAWELTRLEKLYTRQAWLGRKRIERCTSR
jgi:2-polyprenyl-3-methyl-5-hydroxy-6-metoxy-1,4-benzoquinol methylase